MNYSYTTHSLDDKSFEDNANRVKEALLDALEAEGKLKVPAKELCEQYAVLIHRKGRLGAAIDKIFRVKKEDEGYFRVVKMVGVKKEESDESKDNLSSN